MLPGKRESVFLIRPGKRERLRACLVLKQVSGQEPPAQENR
jgi:hypothetical protein